MPKPTLDNAISIGDPLLSDNYELVFDSLPSEITDATEAFRMQCRSVNKPGLTIAEVLVQVFGHTVRHAGQNTVTGSMNVGFVENSELSVYTVLEEWVNFCRNHKTQLGGFKDEYAVNATLRIFKQDGSTAAEYRIKGVWPKTAPELAFEGTGSNALQYDAEFSFDDYDKVA